MADSPLPDVKWRKFLAWIGSNPGDWWPGCTAASAMVSPKRSGSEEGSDMPDRVLVQRLWFEGWGSVLGGCFRVGERKWGGWGEDGECDMAHRGRKSPPPHMHPARPLSPTIMSEPIEGLVILTRSAKGSWTRGTQHPDR